MSYLKIRKEIDSKADITEYFVNVSILTKGTNEIYSRMSIFNGIFQCCHFNIH